ncbi:tetratricopeptide repeat protein [Desulfolithobacter sp.]
MKFRLYRYVGCTTLTLALLFGPGPAGGGQSEPNSPAAGTLGVPERDIAYPGLLAPAWKQTWDLARQLVRERKLGEARIQYQLLLEKKPGVDEARWEYATILIEQKHWDEAGPQLEQLLEHDPENEKYVLALARVSLMTGNYDRALSLYGQFYERNPDSPKAVKALHGLVTVLERQKRPEMVLPLVEQLMLREPGNSALQLKAARLALELDKVERARNLLQTLRHREPDNPEVIGLLARAADRLGLVGEAALWYQVLVGLDPENRQANRWLLTYYHDLNRPAMELRHVEILLKGSPDDAVLLERAGVLNMELGQTGRALDYFHFAQMLDPDNERLAGEKKKAEKKLARELVALVENRGADMLWADLDRITSDRVGVYRAMAELLQAQGKQVELIAVLRILFLENGLTMAECCELTRLLQDRGQGPLPGCCDTAVNSPADGLESQNKAP